MPALIQTFFDETTFTCSHVVYDAVGGHAAVIDPVLNYDPKSGRTATHAANLISNFLRQQALTLDWILETHAHADHLSSAQVLQEQWGGKIAIGAGITQVQSVFKKLFDLGPEFATDGSQFDTLLVDQQVFSIGKLQMKVCHLPGHTPADVAYQVEDAVFVGDTLFMPDVGTARCDFPGGDAHALYRSIHALLALPAQTRLFMCHDYPPAGRTPQWLSTVGEQRAHNIHVHDGVSENDFVALRSARDAGLEMPVLLLPAVQVNIRAGRFPPPASNGISYLKVPLNAL